jgi:hypothetical protein
MQNLDKNFKNRGYTLKNTSTKLHVQIREWGKYGTPLGRPCGALIRAAPQGSGDPCIDGSNSIVGVGASLSDKTI